MTNLESRAPHTLSKEHQKRIKDSDAMRAKNPNKRGPDVLKAKASMKQPETEGEDNVS